MTRIIIVRFLFIRNIFTFRINRFRFLLNIEINKLIRKKLLSFIKAQSEHTRKIKWKRR